MLGGDCSGCCEQCSYTCPCGCSCGSPLPQQIQITVSELPEQISDPNFSTPPCSPLLFNRTYKLCAYTQSADQSQQYCDQFEKPCQTFAGLCDRVASYGWSGVDGPLRPAPADSCAYAAASFGTPGGSRCLDFVFAAASYNVHLTLRGLFTRQVDALGNVTYTPADLSNQCSGIAFEGYSRMWATPSPVTGVYEYTPRLLSPPRLRRGFQFGNAFPLDVYAKVVISGASDCEAELLPSGQPVIKGLNAVASAGSGFDAGEFSQSVTATATIDSWDRGSVLWYLSGIGQDFTSQNPNCNACFTAGEIVAGPPVSTSWNVNRRDPNSVFKCTAAFSDAVNIGQTSGGAPVQSRASIAFYGPGNCLYPVTGWGWSIPMRMPSFTLKAGTCGRANTSWPACPSTDVVWAIAPVTHMGGSTAGGLPPAIYLTHWLSLSGNGASAFTQSLDGSEPAPTHTSGGVTYTMTRAYRLRLTFA